MWRQTDGFFVCVVVALLAAAPLGCADSTGVSDEADATTADVVAPPPGDVLSTPHGDADPSDAAPDTAADTAPDTTPDTAPDTTADTAPDTPEDTTAPPALTYAPAEPLAGPVPAALQGQTWKDHWVNDVAPYWTIDAAKGDPVGNYPTYRGMDGTVQTPSERRPRMISRQVFAYSVGYMLTGDEALLELARAGVDWLIAHARDTDNGGWHGLLDGQGNPKGVGDKLAQDTAYCLLGLAAYFFVTRDAAVEAELLAGRDLLFDPATYWDADNQRILDGLDKTLSTEVDAESDGGWELVAQLDPLNGFLLLMQPVLTDEARRTQVLGDLQTLAQTLIDTFWSDGIFWGVHTKIGQYGTRHVDFGHTLKSYWMLLQVDKRLDDHPFAAFLGEHIHAWVDRAYDVDNGRWAKRMTGATTVEYGSDWWIYAEADQIAATLNLLDHRYTDELTATQANWLTDYVDTTRPAREIVSGIKRDGSWVWPWTDGDTAKCNLWKSGYHSSEHALVLYITGRALEGATVDLHFAVPAIQADTFTARPYIYMGTETARETTGSITVGGESLSEVRVSFDQIW